MTAPAPAILESEIESLVGPRNLYKGKEYSRSGAVVQAVHQGMLLKASCIGSGRTPYQVRVRCGAHGIEEGNCTCPVGEHGHCKHVAAVLVCWIENHAAFTEVESLESALARCSRGKLIEIVNRALEHSPDLEPLIEPLIGQDQMASSRPSAEDCRNQVDALLDHSDAEPAAATLVEPLLAIKHTADQAVRAHEPAAAAAIYQTLITELLAHPELLDARHPELTELVYACAESLGQCLPALREELGARREALHILLDLYRFDVVCGGIAPAADAAQWLLARATEDERQALAESVGAMLASIEDRPARRVLGGLMLELSGHTLTETERYDVCRRSDRVYDLVRRLLLAEQSELALQEAVRADDDELVKIANLLVHYRQEAAALALVRQRVKTSPQPRLRQWLENYASVRSQLRAMIELHEELFGMQPSFSGYRQLRSLARQAGHWDALRPKLLEQVEDSGDAALLVRIYLDENDLDGALELVSGDRAAIDEGHLALQVAKAAERSRPLEAVQIYQAVAERYIGRRGRANYRKAARCLRRVRLVMKRTGRLSDWSVYVRDLKRRHRPLQELFEVLEAGDDKVTR